MGFIWRRKLIFKITLRNYVQCTKKITSIVFYLQQTRSHTSINDNDLEKYIQHNCDERRRSSGFNAHNIVIRKKISVYPERDTNWYPEYLVKTE